MADEVPVTDLLAKLKGSEEAESALANYFWELARQIAFRQLSELPGGVQQFASPSDIANAALRSALSHVAKGDSKVKDRDEFAKLIATIAMRKSISAARHETAGGRDVHRRASLEGYEGDDRAQSPPEVAALKESAERVMVLLLQEQDEKRRIASVLGIVQEYSAKDIQEALTSSYPGEKAPSVSAITVWVRDRRQQVEYLLRKDAGYD